MMTLNFVEVLGTSTTTSLEVTCSWLPVVGAKYSCTISLLSESSTLIESFDTSDSFFTRTFTKGEFKIEIFAINSATGTILSSGSKRIIVIEDIMKAMNMGLRVSE